MIRYLEIIALTVITVSSAGISAGLSRIPCFTTTCSEDYFVTETTIHVAIYYGLLAITSFVLLLRANVPTVRSFMGTHILGRIPVIGRRVTVGGLLTCIWIVGVTGATTVMWLPKHLDFWGARADPLGWLTAKIQLTVTGVTGHYADILLGLLLIPVSRNSIVGRAFSLHPSTLLFAHKMVAYLFSIAVLGHGGTYLSYALDTSSEGNKEREEAFATGNPAMTLSESKKRSSWFTLTTETGLAALLPILAILITSIPWIRRNHYNVFYYNHVFFGIAIVIGASVHASTNLYTVLPGLFLWIADRVHRLWLGEMGGKTVLATVTNAGNGWVRVSLPAKNTKSMSLAEKGVVAGDPMLYYYLSFPKVSRLQNHAFTAVTPGTSENGPVFLLQPATGKKQKRLNKEWTWKLSKLVANPATSLRLNVSVQGPYSVNDDGYQTASHIVCIVGGTGITGACSLAQWWLENGSEESSMTIIWTVRHKESSDVQEWQNLVDASRSNSNLAVVVHVSAEDGRLEPFSCLQGYLAPSGVVSEKSGRAWVYASGPDGLLQATEKACVNVQKDVRRARKGHSDVAWSVRDISWYMARWEV